MVFAAIIKGAAFLCIERGEKEKRRGSYLNGQSGDVLFLKFIKNDSHILTSKIQLNSFETFASKWWKVTYPCLDTNN